MAESRLEQALDSFVFCSMCKEVYDDGDHLAKYLPCLHSFCKSCLQSHVGNEAHFNCPKCQTEIDLKKDGCVDNLPDNFIVSSLEKDLGDLHIAESCGSCDDEKSTVSCFCHDCGFYICQSCADQHKKMRPLRNHKLSPIQMKKPKSSVKKQKFCNKHSNQELTVFCSECQLPVCNTCNTEDHANHQVTGLDDAVKEMTAEIQEASKELSHKKNEILLQINLVKSTQKLMIAKFEKKVKDMQVQKQKLIKSIETQFNKAYIDLKNMYDKEMNRLPDTNKLDSIAEQMKTANEFANTACMTKENVPLLASSQQIKSRLHDLQKYELPDVPIDFKSDVIFTAKHEEAVKQIEEAVQNVFDVNWFTDEQKQVRKDEEEDQKIDTLHSIIENYSLKFGQHCLYAYGGRCSSINGCYCNYQTHLYGLYGTLQVLNVKEQPLTTGPDCNANIEIISQGKSMQTGKASRGRFDVRCWIDKDCLPQVRINGSLNPTIKITKVFLG